MLRHRSCSAVFLVALVISTQVRAGAQETDVPVLQDLGWPRVFEGDGGRVVLYQPQLERWSVTNVLQH